MADRLAERLIAVGLKPVWPVEADLVFVMLPRALDAALRAAGANYYVRSSNSLAVAADEVLVRLVTSFATREDDIERFVNLCRMSSVRLSAAPINVNLAFSGQSWGMRGGGFGGAFWDLRNKGICAFGRVRDHASSHSSARSANGSFARSSALGQRLRRCSDAGDRFRAALRNRADCPRRGIRSTGAALAGRHHLRSTRDGLPWHSHACRRRCAHRRDPRCQSHRSRSGILRCRWIYSGKLRSRRLRSGRLWSGRLQSAWLRPGRLWTPHLWSRWRVTRLRSRHFAAASNAATTVERRSLGGRHAAIGRNAVLADRCSDRSAGGG